MESESKMSEKWKHFERLVAAIHKTADEGADVRWDDCINGRQFDVTIRFKKGLYEYLTVVECKDYGKPVPVEKVEAFVTKALDAHANHAVMASASGFQSGAKAVAQRHSITLIDVTDSSELDFSFFGAHVVDTTEILHIQSIELEYTNGERKRLPEEAHKLNYYAKQIRLRCGAEQTTLEEIVDGQSFRMTHGKVGTYETHAVELPANTEVIGPSDGEIPLKPVERLHVRAGMSKATVIDGPVKIEPYFFTPNVKVHNVKSGREETYNRHTLPLGVDNRLLPGQFYEIPQLDMYYFCESIDNDLAHLFLVESFQHGRLIQAEFQQETKYSGTYVPVTDKATIERLQRRWKLLKASSPR